jgi:putative nucleotidyltransferase with HDIG domain
VDIPQQGDAQRLWKTEASKVSYQTEMFPGLAAREMKRSTALRISSTPLLGTDDASRVSPIWGRIKRIPEGLLKFDHQAEPAITAFAFSLAAAALLLATILVFLGYPLGNVWAIAGLSGAAGIAERGKIKLNSTAKASISLFPQLIAAVLFGPLAAMVVSVASMCGVFPRPFVRWFTYISGRSIGAACAGLVAIHVSAGHTDVTKIAIATSGAVLTAQASDVAFAAFLFKLRGHGNPLALLRTAGPLLVAALPLYAPVVALLVFGYREVSPWTLPLFLAPALAAQRSYLMYQDQRRLAEDLADANLQLERANLSFASALVATLDARDRYTAGHSAAVAIYAKDIAQRLGLDARDQQLAHLCGLVHDIGKIGLPPGLLEKPGALTLDERRQMEEHPVIGERILAKVDDYAEIATVVRHHHERVDGEGYPDGLVSDEIPLVSRIISVADAYNAMTSDRPYRDAMPSQVARLRLAQAVESQFDTMIVAAFEAILAGANEDYRRGMRMDFKLEIEEWTTPQLRAVSAA